MDRLIRSKLFSPTLPSGTPVQATDRKQSEKYHNKNEKKLAREVSLPSDCEEAKEH